MEPHADLRPLAAVLAPLVAAALVLASGRRPNLRDLWSPLAAVAGLGLLASMLPEVRSGTLPASAPLEIAPGFALRLRADPLGLLFAMLACGLWVVTAVYNVGYMRGAGEKRQTGYFAAFAVCVSSAVGVALAANLVTFLLFYEVLTVATWPLVAHKRTGEAVSAGRQYLAYTLGAGQLLLVAVVATAWIAPGAEFRPGGFLAGRADAGGLLLLFGLFVAGCGVKAAIMPLHGWLPAAMVAPTPVSALLHAVAVVKAGTFGILRVVGYVFGVDLLRELGADRVLAAAAVATILLASLRALGESELKRRLAYSTVSQLSYIVLGAAVGSAAALAGAMFHVAAHGVMKITLFFCAGSLYVRTHRTRVGELDGIGRRMPVTMGAFAVGVLGLAGIPAFAGFVGKWDLGVGSIEAGQGAFVAVLVLSGLLNVAYFFPIVYAAFFGGEGRVRFDEGSPALWVPLALTAVATIVLGLAPSAGLGFHDLAWQAARSVVGGGRP
jgi:multicomponent Na+:H+ antiporter subunit D